GAHREAAPRPSFASARGCTRRGGRARGARPRRRPDNVPQARQCAELGGYAAREALVGARAVQAASRTARAPKTMADIHSGAQRTRDLRFRGGALRAEGALRREDRARARARRRSSRYALSRDLRRWRSRLERRRTAAHRGRRGGRSFQHAAGAVRGVPRSGFDAVRDGEERATPRRGGENEAMSDIDVAVVIVTYKTADLTIDCLRSVAAERLTSRIPIRAIVVDNASDDASSISRAIEANGWSSWVTLVIAPRNGGFAYGNNVV